MTSVDAEVGSGAPGRANGSGAARAHVLTELGFTVGAAGEELHGRAARVTPEMHAPATGRLRTSVLAMWADTILGLLAARVMGPQVPVTLDLDVHLSGSAPAGGPVHARAHVLKEGRTVFVGAVDFASDDEIFASGSATFMLAHDRSLRLPDGFSIESAMDAEPTLAVPLTDRVRCRRVSPGATEMPMSEDGLNSSRTVNGGLIALAAEEAALSLVGGGPEDPPVTLGSIALRYLRPVRTGPVTATATSAGAGLGRVELRDAGAGHRLAAVATTRIFPVSTTTEEWEDTCPRAI